jgi:multisubunit Na+/H+ antiporter MnhB subunit
MIYARSMVLRIAVFGVPAIAVVGLVLLLNGLEASPGLALAAYALVAVSTGAVIGYFADRLLEPKRRSPVSGSD